MLPVAGLLSLFWFLVRVVPKPSRASYPCQRAAAPLAAGFVVWLAGAFGSVALFRRGKRLWPGSRTWAAASLAAAATLAIVVLATMPQPAAVAEPNQPIGVGKGIHPGRVVWTHDARATRWAGPGKGHPWENEQTSRPAVDAMMSNSVRRLTGETTDRAAWQALFRHFNSTHGGGNAAYRAGEKITIKVNFVGCIFTEGNVDTKTYDLTAPRRIDYMNTSPQLIGALLRQLVANAGVRQEDIAVGDPTALFPNQYYDLLHAEFPKVRYMDHNGGIDGHPRERAALSQTPLYWSARPEGREQDFVPVQYAEAKYLINMANLKAHTMAGVTLTAKNHFGSLIRTPPQRGYFDMHASTAGRNPGMGKYRDLVDLIGHAHLGGKTLIYFIDGLYPGVHPIENFPRKFSAPPFNGSWGASLFASEDPVAIDSVGLDFLAAEWDNYPRMNGVDDYLHEAALAANPPSGTFYDPNHATATTRLASLGVHEHWNNPQERKYSRNLGKSEGIELVQ
jgi:hypothetical protein